MSYRLDEIKDYLIEDDGCFNGDFEDELYDLFSSEWGEKVTLSLPEFELNGVKYPAKVFNLEKSAKKELDDYCEGKTSYHYDIEILDVDTLAQYNVCTSYCNDERESIYIEYMGLKAPVSKSACCENPKFVSVSGKCSDMFSYRDGEDWKDGSPSELKLGSCDYIEFTYCKSCGKIKF